MSMSTPSGNKLTETAVTLLRWWTPSNCSMAQRCCDITSNGAELIRPQRFTGRRP